MKNLRVARRYARALMAVAEERKALDRTVADLEIVGALLRGSRELRLFLARPIVSEEKKRAVLRELFRPSLGPLTMEFVDLLVAKKREPELLEIIEQFGELRDEHLGIVNVDVISAVELSPPQVQDLTRNLEQHTRKKVRMRFTVDKAVRGGFLARIGDTVMDASLRHQLDLLRECFAGGGPLTN
jgi:F-type H+-transporting ATPase subunit delta